MNVVEVHISILVRLRSYLIEFGFVPDEHAQKNTLQYVAWFASYAIARSREIPIDKLGRWVGFVQGAMVFSGLIDVDEERDCTRPLFLEAYGKDK